MKFPHALTATAIALASPFACAQVNTIYGPESAADRAISLIYDGNTSEVERLLERGLNPNSKDQSGVPLLFAAVSTKQTRLSRNLIERGADVNVKGEAQRIPVFNNACFNGDLAICELLLKHGANPKVADSFGGTAVEDAAHSGSKTLVKKLISLGLETKWPLHVAAGVGDIETVKRLVNEKNINEGRKGWLDTPLSFAASGGQAEVVKLLLELGAEPNLPDAADSFPLHYAAEKGSIEICHLLLKSGAQVNAIVGETMPPLDSATDEKVVRFLRGQGAKTWEELSFQSGPPLKAIWKDFLARERQTRTLPAK